MGTAEPGADAPSLLRARLYVAAAAVLFSTGGAFAKALTQETGLGLNHPLLDRMQIAALRVLIAGAVLVPFLRPADFRFRPLMLLGVLVFAVMNAAFMFALLKGTAANAVLLQYAAPMWVYLFGVGFLGEKGDWRSGVSVVIGVGGVGVIVAGHWEGEQVPVVLAALLAGVAFAGVILILGRLRDASSRLVTTMNLLFSGVVLLPFVGAWTIPSPAQVVLLLCYGGLQMALPYWLMARGLSRLSPQEAGTLTLLEPLLAPLWACLASPGTEGLSVYTMVGGACIVGALAYRYWPRNEPRRSGSAPSAP
jgi:drug/metabolite transporter (DMT)-like permease